MKAPSDSGQAPSVSSPDASCQPRGQPLTQPWQCPGAACLCCQCMESLPEDMDKRCPVTFLGEFRAETSTLLVSHTRKTCAYVCTSGTRSTLPLPTLAHRQGPVPVTWNKTCASQRAKGRCWSQDGKAQKPPPCCPRNFLWLTRAPLLFGSIFLPLLAVRTTVIPDGLCSHASPTQCARTRALTCFV